MEWSGRAPAPPARDAGRGLAIRGAQPCPTNPMRPLPRGHRYWLKELGLVDRTDPAMLVVAKYIIAFAKAGERDPVRLRELTLEAVQSNLSPSFPARPYSAALQGAYDGRFRAHRRKGGRRQLRLNTVAACEPWRAARLVLIATFRPTEYLMAPASYLPRAAGPRTRPWSFKVAPWRDRGLVIVVGPSARGVAQRVGVNDGPWHRITISQLG
jgi:hypothetical protein